MIRPEDLFIQYWHRDAYGDGAHPGTKAFDDPRVKERWLRVWLDCVALVELFKRGEQTTSAVAAQTMADEEVTLK
jgi:hypothetical protein